MFRSSISQRRQDRIDQYHQVRMLCKKLMQERKIYPTSSEMLTNRDSLPKRYKKPPRFKKMIIRVVDQDIMTTLMEIHSS